MITTTSRKKTGPARFERIRDVRYLSWEDTFEVQFDSGLAYLVSNRDLRRSNRLLQKTTPVESVWVEPDLKSGFFVRYENGDVAEASWEFVKEHA